MKKLLIPLLCIATLTGTAHASETPSQLIIEGEVVTLTDVSNEYMLNSGIITLRDVQQVDEGNTQRIIKSWEVPPDYNANDLIEQPFEQNGYNYTNSYVIMLSENYDTDRKLASQTMVIPHEQKDGAIAKFSPLIDYNQNGYTGQLTLDATTIYTEDKASENYTYSVTDIREYTGLSSNDTYNIPKNVVKNGSTLTLSDVQWTMLGDKSYIATAYYGGYATGVNVTAYQSTATYMGEVEKSTLESITYAVVYDGKPIPLPTPDYLPYVLIGVGAAGMIIMGTVLWNNRKNTKIYAMVDGQYRVVQKVKLSYLDPIIDLTAPSLGDMARDYLISVDRFAAKRLNNQSIRVICADGTVKEHSMQNNGYGCKLKVANTEAEI